MNVYALFPLVAVAAFIPLLVSTAAARPRRKQHTLFLIYLVAAMMWSLTDYISRSNFFPEYSLFLLKCVLVMYVAMAVQFHCFSSSFFHPGQGRWLPLAYATLIMVIVLAATGLFPKGVKVVGDAIYPHYGIDVIFIAVPLITLVARNAYVFGKRLKYLDNPALYNQIVSLLLGLAVLTVFTLVAFLPWGREFPVSHIGNIVNAVILSYAVVRHRLVDIKFVLRKGLSWLSIFVVGAVCYWALIMGLQAIFHFNIDGAIWLVAGLLVCFIGFLIYKLHGFFLSAMSKAIEGQSYDDRQKLTDFASNIDRVFSLKEQGGELLMLVTKAFECEKASLLFIEARSDDFITQFADPNTENNTLRNFRLASHNPIVDYLKQEREPLTRAKLNVQPEFRGLWQSEREVIRTNGVEILMPLISRERLVGILVLGKKKSGRYSLADFHLLGEVADRVAVGMEKEYIREQLREREKELSVINRSNLIIASDLDIKRVYGSFVKELKELVPVSLAAINLIEGDEIYILALSSDTSSPWQAGQRMPIAGTATEWVANHRKALIEADLALESRFVTGKYHIEQGVRSIIYLPLINKNKVIGSLIVGSCNPNDYHFRNIQLLEGLAEQLAIATENSRLYAKAEQKARIDGLTGLLNRRSLDEIMNNELNRHTRYGGVFSVVILDLDSFKSFNDTYGHLAGDALLERVGRIMKSSIRTVDQAFRYGGDEFALLLPQTNSEAAFNVAERIRKQVNAEAKAGPMPVTVSIGIASWPADGIKTNDVIAAADIALYHAKRNGCNRSHRFTRGLLSADETAAVTNSDDSDIVSAIYSMAEAVDERDQSSGHSQRVSQYSISIAEALNLEPAEVRRLSTCALLHDIGKIGVPNDVLKKTEKLTDEEWETIKMHPQLGASIASHSRNLASCVSGILHHHERYNGSGYPKGIKGDEIPLEARVLSIADAYAAMTANRPYSAALSREGAMEELKNGAGTQFDPFLVEVFLTILKSQEVTLSGKRKKEV